MPHFKAIHPVLPVRDVTAAMDYYTARLGFRLIFQDDEADPKYAVVARDEVKLHLQWHDEGDFDGGDQAALRFVIDDVDGLFAEYADKDVFHERTTVRDTPWGTREFAFYDCDGNGLFFYRLLAPG